MYESQFGLSTRPFLEIPDADLYFSSESAETARSTIVRCLTRGSGIALIMGAPGTGKTIVCRAIAEQLRSRFPIANLHWGNPSTRRGLLQAILYELNLPFRNLDEGELRLSLIDHMTRSPNCPHGMVLIVDEAQTLTTELLEELRVLTNLVANREPRVRLVLSGEPSLEEVLAESRLQSLNQRIAARCTLHGFRQDETAQYITQQIDRCGGVSNRVFEHAAIERVHTLTDGVPRLINQLCDHALIMACVNGAGTVNAQRVEEAWSDLQQLPVTWNRFRPDTPDENSIVEFGSLDDFADQDLDTNASVQAGSSPPHEPESSTLASSDAGGASRGRALQVAWPDDDDTESATTEQLGQDLSDEVRPKVDAQPESHADQRPRPTLQQGDEPSNGTHPTSTVAQPMAATLLDEHIKTNTSGLFGFAFEEDEMVVDPYRQSTTLRIGDTGLTPVVDTRPASGPVTVVVETSDVIRDIESEQPTQPFSDVEQSNAAPDHPDRRALETPDGDSQENDNVEYRMSETPFDTVESHIGAECGGSVDMSAIQSSLLGATTGTATKERCGYEPPLRQPARRSYRWLFTELAASKHSTMGDE